MSKYPVPGKLRRGTSQQDIIGWWESQESGTGAAKSQLIGEVADDVSTGESSTKRQRLALVSSDTTQIQVKNPGAAGTEIFTMSSSSSDTTLIVDQLKSCLPAGYSAVITSTRKLSVESDGNDNDNETVGETFTKLVHGLNAIGFHRE